MTTPNSKLSQDVKRRQRAEQQAGVASQLPMPQAPEAIQQTLHELRVHQIQLKMQNEELRRTQAELDAERNRYFEFYNLSPVGYLTLSETGLIVEANLTATTLLGLDRRALLKQPISRFILPADQDLHYLRRNTLFGNGAPQAYDLRMLKTDGAVFWAHLKTAVVPGAHAPPACRVVLSDITERKQMEEALRTTKFRLRQLLVELSQAEEREQQRLAAYLHEEVSQTLASLRMKLGTLATTLGAGPAQAEIVQICDLLKMTINQMRSLVFDLMPPILSQLGLAAAVEWFGEKTCREHHLTFVGRDNGDPKPLDDKQKILLFRCARELMTNTVKHAKATRLTATADWLDDRVCVSVEDDGCGFDVSRLDWQLHEVGFGLFNVRERLTAIGGQCAISSAPGGGTRVTLTIPLPPPARTRPPKNRPPAKKGHFHENRDRR